MTHWLETWTGEKFDFEVLDPGAIYLEDIAHHLSMVCRFNGAVSHFYSVAEHSVRVLLHVENHSGGGERVATGSTRAWSASPSRWALLHDASEAYLSDVNKPAKSTTELAGYCRLEARVMEAVKTRFGLTGECPKLVKVADLVLLQTERHALKDSFEHSWDVDDLGVEACSACAITFGGWDPLTAKVAFLQHAKRLGLK